MPDALFLALYRFAIRLGPRALRERHEGELLELVNRMLQEEAPRSVLSAPAWKVLRLAKAVSASLGAHLDRRRARLSPFRSRKGPHMVIDDLRHSLRRLRS